MRHSLHDEAVTLLHQGEVAAAGGSYAEAAALLARASSAFSSMNMRWHQLQAQRASIPQ